MLHLSLIPSELDPAEMSLGASQSADETFASVVSLDIGFFRRMTDDGAPLNVSAANQIGTRSGNGKHLSGSGPDHAVIGPQSS